MNINAAIIKEIRDKLTAPTTVISLLLKGKNPPESLLKLSQKNLNTIAKLLHAIDI